MITTCQILKMTLPNARRLQYRSLHTVVRSDSKPVLEDAVILDKAKASNAVWWVSPILEPSEECYEILLI